MVENVTVTCLAENCFQLEMAADQAPAIWLALAASANPVASASWDWLTIRAGVPVVLPATQETFVLQMINLDLIGGVSFKKGCYPGQEIVARMHYLGKLKRRMYLAHIESELPPQAGDELFSAEMEGQASGTIVNASAAPTGGYDVLAVVQIASRDTQSIHLTSLTGPVLAFQSLPYSLP
jgi:folate-binding protein YgfZ